MEPVTISQSTLSILLQLARLGLQANVAKMEAKSIAAAGKAISDGEDALTQGKVSDVGKSEPAAEDAQQA